MYNWLSRERAGPVFIDGGNQRRTPSRRRKPRRSIYARLRREEADRSVDVRLAEMMMRMGHTHGNSVGVVVEASGVIYSYGNNQFRSNGSNVTGSLTAITGL